MKVELARNKDWTLIMPLVLIAAHKLIYLSSKIYSEMYILMQKIRILNFPTMNVSML